MDEAVGGWLDKGVGGGMNGGMGLTVGWRGVLRDEWRLVWTIG